MKVKYERLKSRSNLEARVVKSDPYGSLKGRILKDKTVHICLYHQKKLERPIIPPANYYIQREIREVHLKPNTPISEIITDPIYLFGYKPKTGTDQK